MSTDSSDINPAVGCPVHGDVDQLLATASLKNPDVCAHPNAYYAAMRAQDPVHFDQKLGVWLVSRFLARMELKVAARELIQRLDNFKIEIPVEQVRFMPTVSTRTIAALPVSFTRRQ